MSRSKLVEAWGFGTTTEAELARAVLAGEGITAFVEAAESNVMLPHLATGVEGLVKLMVSEDDLQAALDVLDRHYGGEEQSDAPDHEWKCPNCLATVDAGFAVCWSCGQSYDPSLPNA